MTEQGGRVLGRRALAIVTGVIGIYLVVATGQRALDAYRANQQLAAAHREIAALRQRNIELQAELESTEDEAIERTAREELGLVRPGDHPVVLIWPNGAPSVATPVPAVTPAPEGRWQQLLRSLLSEGPR